MTTYEKFYDSLLPGNYALTKSMELTKLNKSGTLWYTYKFIVLYYYVFLSNDIDTREYVKPVTESFDNYISALPPEIQKSAQEFFYPDNPTINFKSEQFKSFKSFAPVTDFETAAQRAEYFSRAKKCYFAALMNSGGQTGVKKSFAETLADADFSYPAEGVAQILYDAAVKSLVADANALHAVSDNSVNKIISESAVKKIIEASNNHAVTFDEAVKIANDYPHSSPNYKLIESDTVAFIRNERQILYYYGYFHSKSSGASDREFSSLTPVGELAIKANAAEFAAIWEHQKIKMISQPVTVDINNLSPDCGNPENFAISFTPYTDILGHLLRNGGLSYDQYQYIVSRRKRTISDDEWQAAEEEILGHLDDVRAKITSFNRRRDAENEDGRKELLKYILGLRSDLPFDNNQNFLNVLSYKPKGIIQCGSPDKLQIIYLIYKKLDGYKAERYGYLFSRCEADLKGRYAEACAQKTAKPDPRVKIEWDLYNIRMDKLIFLGAAIATAAANCGASQLEEITPEKGAEIAEYCANYYSYALKTLGITGAKIAKEINKALNAFKNNDYSRYLAENEERYAYSFNDYGKLSNADLLKKIEEVSAAASADASGERKRNGNLINLVKTYLTNLSGGEKLKCECCGQETFITEAGDFYIELHHLIPFKKATGPDHYLNLYALCPNCHRKLHYINLDEKGGYYKLLDVNNYYRMTIIERLLQLKAERLLRSYHLEYLLADNAISQSEYDGIA